MFAALTPDVLDHMDEFQIRLAGPAGTTGTARVIAALEQTAAALSDWTGDTDPARRHEKQTLHAGMRAAADICLAVVAKHA